MKTKTMFDELKPHMNEVCRILKEREARGTLYAVLQADNEMVMYDWVK